MHAFLPHAHEVDQRSPCQFSSHIWMHNNNVNKKIHPGLGNWLLMQQQHKNQSNQSGSESWSSTWLFSLEEICIYILYFFFLLRCCQHKSHRVSKAVRIELSTMGPFEFVLPLKNHLNPNLHISTQVINIICLRW